MFEQSMLLDHTAGNKTGALAASLTAQTLAIGVLILIPLIYNDRLPSVRPISLALPPLSSPDPAPEPAPTTTSSSRPTLSTRRILQLPSRIPQLFDTTPVALEAPSLPLGALDGVPPGPAATVPFHIDTPPAAPARVADPPKAPVKPQPVGGEVQAAKLIKKVIPVYPWIARQARVSGTVRLVGIVAKDGTIQQLQVVSGHPLLTGAALEAVRHWVYRPTLLNGEPVEVIAPIDVIFTLSQ
jgi:protein TonB